MSIEGGRKGDRRRKGRRERFEGGEGIRGSLASQPASQPAIHRGNSAFLSAITLFSRLPSPRVLFSAPLISPPSLALPAFTHTSRRRKGRSSCVKLVAKRADERACMRILFLLEETWGLARRGAEEREGGRGGKNEEGKRGQQRLSRARGEAERGRGSTTLPSLENFPWIR